MKATKALVAPVAALAFLTIPVSTFAQSSSPTAAALVQGFEAYRQEDWTSALFFLRKAVADSTVSTDETWYMLIMSEVYAGEYAAANADCDRFIKLFTFSQYMPYIQYQKGRCLHYLNQNENAVLVLSDFCHQNPESALYASALYWIAEAFFSEYNYDSARALYERIVIDFPDDAKVGAAQYRLESIDQRSREEKLLYLLKVTGEESLAAREEYERQIRQYEAEDKLGLRKQLNLAEARVSALERENAALRAEKNTVTPVVSIPEYTASSAAERPSAEQSIVSESAASSAPVSAAGSVPATLTEQKDTVEVDAEVEALKRKARHLQYLLDEQRSTESVQ